MIDALVLGLVIVALVVRDVLRERTIAHRERDWFVERSELLSRIQHPEVFVPPAALAPLQTQARSEPSDDDFERVGGVFYDEAEAA